MLKKKKKEGFKKREDRQIQNVHHRGVRSASFYQWSCWKVEFESSDTRRMVRATWLCLVRNSEHSLSLREHTHTPACI